MAPRPWAMSPPTTNTRSHLCRRRRRLKVPSPRAAGTVTMGGAVREARPVVALGLIGTERLGHRIYRAVEETAAVVGINNIHNRTVWERVMMMMMMMTSFSPTQPNPPDARLRRYLQWNLGVASWRYIVLPSPAPLPDSNHHPHYLPPILFPRPASRPQIRLEGAIGETSRPHSPSFPTSDYSSAHYCPVVAAVAEMHLAASYSSS